MKERSTKSASFAKHFVDRNRALDEQCVREELASQADSLVTKKKNRLKSDGLQRRRKTHWANYRQVSPMEVSRITSFEKFSRILANEVHLGNKKVAGFENRIGLLEERLTELVASRDSVSHKELVALVKCLYQFGVVRQIEPVLLNRILDRVDVKQVKPINVVYLLEALNRLAFRDHRSLEYLNSLSLCWPVVGRDPLMVIKAANAIAGLDLAKSSPSLGGLIVAISEALPKLTKSQLERVKAVTVAELFDDLMVLDFFVLAHQHRIQYVRHLVLVFLKVRSNQGLMAKIPQIVRDWIDEVVREDSQVRTTPAKFSSELHRDISRVLHSALPHAVVVDSLNCGPFLLDSLVDNTVVVEACSPFQFYTRTAKFTAEARLRHELIRSLGFELVLISHFQWSGSDEAKQAFLFSQLPAKLRSKS